MTKRRRRKRFLNYFNVVDTDSCEGVLCLHQGTCIKKDHETFTCLCPLGYTGEHCEEG